MARRSRIAASLVAGALLGSFIQTPAFASAPSSGHGGGPGIIGTVKGWFGGGHSAPKPPTGPKDAIADRQKLPPGKKAPKAHLVRELTSKRTPSARYWKLSDGTTQAEVSAVPLSYHSAHGWKAIDTKVAATGRAGYRYANTTNLARSYFGSRSGNLLRFEADGKHAVTLGLAGADKGVPPVAKGDTVTYRGLAGGADVDYRVGRGEVKENIVLNRAPSSPVSFTFTLKTGGLTPKELKDGSIGLYGGRESGRPVLVIPAAVMFQAPANSDAPVADLTHGRVVQKLTRHRSTWRITLTPDARWLAAPGRRFPVTVDPTIVLAPTPSTSQDVMVDSTQSTTNLNGTWQLGVGTTATGKLRSLLKFPLTGIPSNTKITSAKLGVYYNQVHTSNTNSVVIEAHRATGAWDASTATWNSTSALSGELSGTTVQLDDGDTGTAAKGSWPYSTNSAYTQYAVNGDYAYNKDAVAGDTYTWQPTVAQAGSYRVDVHSIPASDRATNAPYSVTYNGGTYNGTIDQSAGSGGVWRSLNNGTALPFSAGTAGKIVLGDGPASTTTSVIADAVRLVEPGTTLTKAAGSYDQWHNFAVTDTVQKWVNGTTNNGFVLQAADESTLGQGGPLYEAGEYAYGGETATYPKLTVVYGTPGVAVNPPTVIHATGAELSWPAYTNTTGDPANDLAEYQVHRSVYQGFTPTSATLVAPVAAGTTSFTDTTAVPTPADAPDDFHAVYYEVAVKTKGGQVIGGPVQLADLPKAGQTRQIIQSGQSDATLSSAQPATAHDTIASDGANQNWFTVGNNSATYGKTRAVLKFPTSSLPSTARVLDAQVQAESTITTNTGGGSASYELHGLTKDFDEATATWNNATSITAWTTAGGDYSATVNDADTGFTNDPVRHWWDATSLTQGWINTPSSNHGVLIKVRDESTTGPQERSVFLSSETSEPQLRPQLVVTYVDATTNSTYYAPQVPQRMTPGTTYNVDLSLTNTTNTTWAAADQVVSYRWTLPDGTDVTNGGNQIQTALPSDLVPGQTVTIHAQVKAPTNADSGNPTNSRTQYTLTWDVFNKTNSTWNSASGGVAGLAQAETVEDPTSDQIGLEKFYSYTGMATGAGSSVMTNLASGNNVFSYNAFSNPGRGLGTFTRFAYNSLDTSDTVMGPGWSAQASAPVRLGAALDFHPNPNPTEVTLTDGDGTASVFTKQADGTFKAPAGVHFLLAMKGGVTCTPDKDDTPDAWSMTKPDGTRFFYDCDGYVTSIVDKNGNTETFTYAIRRSNNKPTHFLSYITDPAGRQTLTVTYYNKGDNYSYVDGTGNLVSDTNLTNPKIIDHLASMTDISGRQVMFNYTTQGLMGRLTDGAGSAQPKVFKFTYDATQGTKNVKLVTITDPRGHDTKLNYYAPQTGDNPKYHWWAKTLTDRLNNNTSIGYAVDASNNAFTDTTMTDANSHVTKYVTDDFSRPVQSTNAKNEVTKLTWDADNNVTSVIEENGATTTYTYDPKTGYPLTMKDAEANKNGWPASVYTYQTRLDGYSADLFTKTSPEGRKWQFGYDSFGNLTSVQDPKGVAAGSGYTTTYGYDSYGELKTATDANGHATNYSAFDANGYPQTETDALGDVNQTAYDVRGEVLSVTDALNKTTTETYDTYGRPLVSKVPKDQAAGSYITAPAPVYDANDNVTQATAPNGAVSTAVFDNADELTSNTGPKDNSSDPDRITSYTYDHVGNLLSSTSPNGNLPGATPGSYTSTTGYDVLNRPVSLTDAAGHVTTTTYDNVGNSVQVVDPLKNLTADSTDYTSKYAYNLNHQAISVTDAAGHTKQTGYDKDGLQTSTTDEDGNKTLYTYDERGMVSQVQVPHDGSSPIMYDTTKYDYDQVGNQTKVYSPRAVAANSTTAFTTQTTYDELNRVKRTYQAYDPNDSRYNNANVYTENTYDADGRLQKVSAPPSAGQSVRNDTSYTYWDDGQAKTSTDPWDITTSYDHDEMGDQTSRTITSAGGSQARTMNWTYYPDGMIHTRTDNGVPVGLQVDLADNSDVQSVATTGSWPTANSGSDHQGYDYATHAAGTGSDSFTWNLTVPQDGTYQVYVKYPQVTGAATTASYTVGYHGGTATKAVDQTKNTGTWVSLGSYAFTAADTTQKVTLAQNSGGTVAADAVKIVRDNSADTDNEKTAFTYSYDASGNLVDLADATPGARYDDYAATFDGVNLLSKLEVKKSGSAVHTTSFSYDADGNTLSRSHDATVADFQYDVRNLLQKVTNKETATDTSPKVTQFTYTPGGQIATETKANGNVTTSDYFLDGALKHQLEKKSDGSTVVAEHTYTYDPDGNTTEDTSKVQNADDHAAYKNQTLDYAYTPRDQVASVTKTGGGQNESYVYDGNGNVTSATSGGQTTTSNYDRNRLATTVVGGVTSGYHYDPYGRLDNVTTGGNVIERYTYDGFDHISSEQKKNGTGYDTTNFTYDPFDRTVSQTQNAGATGEKTTVFDYLAMSSAVVSETENSKVTKTYQYSPWGERLSQVKIKSDGTEEPTYYSYDAHSNVQAVTDAGGDTKSTYGYTAYGSDDSSQDTGADKPGTGSATDPYNAYRFNADRVDGSTGTYNMGFRTYDPGLNRFLSRDMYNGALGDMGLVSDPLTGNRYAFAGGNPISNIELDGHGWLSDLGHAALDVAGMVPVVGAVADVANGAWYAAEGDYLDAGISFAGAIPVIGDAALGARMAVKGAKYAAEGAEALQGLKNADHLVNDAKALEHAGEDAADVDKAAQKARQEQAAADKAAREEAARKAEEAAAQARAEAKAEAQAEATAESKAEQAAEGATCSFAPSTPVLMEHGKTKPIGQLKPGDKVESADPETGKDKGARTVLATLVNHDTDLVDVTLDTGHGHTATLHTTSKHPFYDKTTRSWVSAGKFVKGHVLETPDGRTGVRVTSVTSTPGAADRYNLTVQELHTYYVLAGGIPVLVHNTCPNLNSGNSPAAAQGTAVHNGPEWAEHLDSLGYSPGREVSPGNIPDGFTDAGFPVELKPATKSGIRAGTRQLRRYMKAMGVDYGELWTYQFTQDGVAFSLTAIPKSPFRWLKWL
ncbi:golvesin C-terminal-like domain-containing protein [Streptomyces sp. NPDC002758]